MLARRRTECARCWDLELERPCKSFGGDDASATSTCGRSDPAEWWEKAARPNRHHGRGVVRVRDVGEKVIRVVERDEALGCLDATKMRDAWSMPTT